MLSLGWGSSPFMEQTVLQVLGGALFASRLRKKLGLKIMKRLRLHCHPLVAAKAPLYM